MTGPSEQTAKHYLFTVLGRNPQKACYAFGEFRGGRVLGSPIGKRPGVLFSALAACRGAGQADPSSCLVI